MNLKLGTKVLWIHSFAIGIFVLLNYALAVWLFRIFGTTITVNKALWFLELSIYVLWASTLFLIGGLWNLIPEGEEE